MKRGIYVGIILAILGGVGISYYPGLMKDIETIIQSNWGLISAILLSSFLWKFLLKRVVYSTSMGIQQSKSRK
jgi:hypothetical protein